jgi:hypothetical protein
MFSVTWKLSYLSDCILAYAMPCLRKMNDPTNKSLFLDFRKKLLCLVSFPGILVLAKGTVTDSIKAYICIVLCIKMSLDGTEVWLFLLPQKVDTFLDYFFSFGFRETFEGQQHAMQCKE